MKDEAERQVKGLGIASQRRYKREGTAEGEGKAAAGEMAVRYRYRWATTSRCGTPTMKLSNPAAS
jgi:hypothetical protein